MNTSVRAVRRTCWAILVTLAVGGGQALQAADAPPAPDQGDVVFVFAGMREESSRLHSGLCRIEGTRTERDPSGKDSEQSYEQHILVAFDEGKKLRFDRTQMGWVADPTTAKPNPDDPSGLSMISSTKRALVKRHYYTDGEKDCFWQEGSPLIDLSKAGSFDPVSRIDFFDVRALGLYDWTTLSRGNHFSELTEAFQSRVKGVNKSSSPIWTLVQDMSDPQLLTQRLIYVDVEHGFTPVQVDVRERPRKDPLPSWDVMESSTTKWEQRSGVWVPISHKTRVGRGGVQSYSLSLQLSWEKVNEPIPAAYFTYEDFHAPDAVGIIDASLGQPVIVKPFVQVIPHAPATSQALSLGLRILLGIGIPALAAGLAALVWYRRKIFRIGK